MRTIEVDESDSSGGTIATILIGAVAGFAVGMYVAQRVGGFSGLASKLRPRSKRASGEVPAQTQAYYEADGEGFVDEELSDLDDELLDGEDDRLTEIVDEEAESREPKAE